MDLRNLNKINNNVNEENENKILEENFSSSNKPKVLEKIEMSNNSTKAIEKKNIHGGHRNRLKSQFLEHGIDSLTDIQKLELILFYSIPQKDTNPIAHELLNEFKSLKKILSAEPNELMKINGVKENTATLIKLVNGLINVVSRPNMEDVISSTAKAREFCTKLYTGADVEQFYVICLAKSNKIIKAKLIGSGTNDEVNVQIRHITAFAIENKCNRIIVSHNHPTGRGVMSDEDGAFTYSLICSCLLNSIDVLDHIIVGIDRTISLCEQGFLNKLKKRAVETIQISKEKFKLISSSGDEYIVSEQE